MDALELILFCAWCFAVALAGGAVGLVLGNIRLPAVLLLASSPAAGAGANIGISGVAAFAAAAAHVRAGRINWRLFAWMAPPSMAGAVAGGLVSGAIPDTALLIVIGLTLLYFGIDLLRKEGRRAPAAASRPERAAPGESPPAPGEHLDLRAAVVSGALIGLLGGLVGLILGALRMPALLRWVGEAPHKAVGTNLAVGFWVGVAGVAGHLPGGVDWTALGAGAAASVPGALLGARLTGRMSERKLLRAIGAALVVAGAATTVQAL
ncbi:MAG TPA: sulfite exporter TauE/SafE family protein [Thermoleophilaceae bacterium]|nr:sulfite exporter TauE/SafE family protein [Thermoleophilaceae bacterium]